MTNLRIDFELIFALIIKDSGVATDDFLSTKFEPSDSDQSVKFIMNIYFVDVKVFFALIDNGNPFSMDIKFENFSDDIILWKMVEIWIDSWINRETIEPEFTFCGIINNFDDPVRKDLVITDLFDQNIVLDCINED